MNVFPLLYPLSSFLQPQQVVQPLYRIQPTTTSQHKRQLRQLLFEIHTGNMGWNSVEYWHNILSSDRSDSEPDHLTSEADIWDSEPDTRASETKTWVPRSAQGDSETNRWNEESDNQASETDHQSTYRWDPILNSRSSEPDRSFSKPNHWSAGLPFRRQIRMGRPSTYVFDSYGDTCITLYTSKDRTFSFSGDTLSNVTFDEVSHSEFNVSNDWGEVAHKDCDAASVHSSDSRHEYHEYGEIPGSSPGQVEIRVFSFGTELIGDSGFYELQASGWDPVAHQTVLAILHGYHKDVPKSPSIELLAEITMVVNHYGCHESVEPYAKLWLDNMRHRLPFKYGIDCILTLAVSWVFDDQDIFDLMVRVALRNSSGLITVEDDRLPIPDGLFEKINASRERYLEAVSSATAELFHRLRDEDDCPHACSSLMLGRLTKKIYNFDSNGLGSQAFLGWLRIEGCIRDIKSMGDSDLSDWNCRYPSTIFQRLYPALQNAENQLPAFYLKGRMLTVEQEPTVQSEPNPYAHNEENW
ncbi:unnamed protein product [Fusarium graminearum]|uniref:Chromosome 1, complete genome n=2 Tax=Gibberella zeae (strain ATCC MYA-4620 / CBS 123657 / FGSC 9075 / NRRL 31084 / PH-1) TaxID=229533 RepID=A0A098D978_GIBZE|nr:unnamed protein product [Fusarium graminearum]